MNCMKCGREIALGQAFCKDCLEDMSHYPVKPGTPVQIPNHPPVQPFRRTTAIKKARKPEEQIIHLRKVILWQTAAIMVLLVLFVGLGIYTVKKLYPVVQPLGPGENYSTTATTSPSIPWSPQ